MTKFEWAALTNQILKNIKRQEWLGIGHTYDLKRICRSEKDLKWEWDYKVFRKKKNVSKFLQGQNVARYWAKEKGYGHV